MGHLRRFHEVRLLSGLPPTPDVSLRWSHASEYQIPQCRWVVRPGRTAEKETVPPNNVDPKIERRPIGPLRPYERNARKHPPEQVAQIAVAIREWGWTVRIIAWLIGYNWRRSRRSKFQKRLPDR
jgi:hypothetical protein